MAKNLIKEGDGIAYGTGTLNFQQGCEMVLINSKCRSIVKC